MKSVTVVIVIAAATAAIAYLLKTRSSPSRGNDEPFEANPVLSIDMEKLLSALDQVEAIKQKLTK